MQHLTIECGQTWILLFVKNISNSAYQSPKRLGTNCINLLTLLQKDITIVGPAGTEGCRHHCCSFVTLHMKAVFFVGMNTELNVNKRNRLVFRK